MKENRINLSVVELEDKIAPATLGAFGSVGSLDEVRALYGIAVEPPGHTLPGGGDIRLLYGIAIDPGPVVTPGIDPIVQPLYGISIEPPVSHWPFKPFPFNSFPFNVGMSPWGGNLANDIINWRL